MAAPTITDNPGTRPAGDLGYHLLVLGPEHALTRQLPAQGALSIGRGEDADVRIVDALASREHARLYVGESLELEDLGSSNGTLLRDQRIPPHQRIPVSAGEAIAIGSTVLVVQRREPGFTPRLIWPHGYFETRLIETCAQAECARSTFALVRLHAPLQGERATCEAALIAALRPGDVLAAYGPDEYEILLVDTDREKADALTAILVARLKKVGIAARVGMAFFPTDATSPQALVSCACQRVWGESATPGGSGAIVLENPAMRGLYATAEKVARGTINVLLVGETGVGKEILAETIHRSSPRASGPFVGVNCAALSDTLLESELFGYERGAFTGAMQTKLGLMEAASSGTLFLDEVGEMSLNLQVKLLRAIESKQLMRVGATKARAVDVRFVAATNRDLEEEIAAKRFREDLYFRLNGITLEIPPLRERADEIPSLARVFLEAVARQVGQPPPSLSLEVMVQLRAYDWPGNIRELRNVMERAMLLASGGPIGLEQLPKQKLRVAPAGQGPSIPPVIPSTNAPAPPSASPAPRTMRDIEREAILHALARCAGNQTRAAEYLGLPLRTFCTRLKQYNIPRPRT